MTDAAPAPATRVRYGVLVLATLVAVLLYLDRYCLSTADRDVKVELALTEAQMANVLGAFFFTYALGQIPFGYLSDRYGPRAMLTFYILVWSAFTGCLGLARGYLDLLFYRLGCGLFEAGAYPACAGIIKRWIPYQGRGLASGIVSLGGRLGGTITPKLTAVLMVGFLPWYAHDPKQLVPQAAAAQSLGMPAAGVPEIVGAAVAADVATRPFVFGSWRPVMVLYGLLGIVLAAAFWWLSRDTPQQHPRVNQAEIDVITHGDPNPQRYDAAPVSIPWRGVFTNVSLWLCSLVQLGINFGWVFLITYLNRYLAEVHNLPIETRGTMISLVMGLSLPALILGGWWTDRMARAFGPRWGRALPLALTRFVAAAAFIAVLGCDDPWVIVGLLGAVAFFSDLGLPAIWAFNMDVGGRNVGFILGWGNMWGNLGAALSPIILHQVVGSLIARGATVEFAWDAVFLICGIVFLLVGLASLGVDATKRVAS